MINFKKEDTVLGATLSGLDLSVPLEDQDLAALKQALAEHQVIFFHD